MRPDLKPDFEDDELVRCIISGDREAFALVMDRYGKFVSRIVARRIPVQDAEGVVQDSFVRIFQSLGTYSGPNKFKAWVSQVTSCVCVDYWRARERNKETVFSQFDDMQRQGWEAGGSQNATLKFAEDERQKDEWQILEMTLAQLSANDRALITMIYFEGCSLQETAEALGFTLAGTKVRAMRARRRLKAAIVNFGRNL